MDPEQIERLVAEVRRGKQVITEDLKMETYVDGDGNAQVIPVYRLVFSMPGSDAVHTWDYLINVVDGNGVIRRGESNDLGVCTVCGQLAAKSGLAECSKCGRLAHRGCGIDRRSGFLCPRHSPWRPMAMVSVFCRTLLSPFVDFDD